MELFWLAASEMRIPFGERNMDFSNFDWFCYFGSDSFGRKIAYVSRMDSYVFSVLSETQETKDCLIHFAQSNEHFVKPVVLFKEQTEES
jgi:hypothetical protein